MIIWTATAYWEDMSDEEVVPVTATGPTEDMAVANLQNILPHFHWTMDPERREHTHLVTSECHVEGYTITDDVTGQQLPKGDMDGPTGVVSRTRVQ
jgi:hypothetical protein